MISGVSNSPHTLTPTVRGRVRDGCPILYTLTASRRAYEMERRSRALGLTGEKSTNGPRKPDYSFVVRIAADRVCFSLHPDRLRRGISGCGLQAGQAITPRSDQ